MSRDDKHVVWADKKQPGRFYCAGCNWEGEQVDIGKHVVESQYDARWEGPKK